MINIQKRQMTPAQAVKQITTDYSSFNKEYKNGIIESLLLQIPIGPIWANCTGSDSMPLKSLKGDKRLNAIKAYLNNQFPLETTLLPKSFNGKLFSELEPQYKRIIENTYLEVYIVEKCSVTELCVLSRRLNIQD